MSNQLLRTFLLTVLLCLFCSASAFTQTTAFTYQGKLSDNNGNPVTGNYDFEFKLFDTSAVNTGTQLGIVPLSNVAVNAGIFTVQLDFAGCATCFNGANRWLEINVRVAGGGAFTQLSPRQPVTSNPYAIKSLNAATADGLSVACVNCVTSGQIASVNGSTVTGTIPVASVPAGSVNYIQNTTSQQSSANFNISGDGTAGGTLNGNVVNAATQFNIGGNRIIAIDGNDGLFVGLGAGQNNSTGTANSFFGFSAGQLNTMGSGNSFFGDRAGSSNINGGNNAFFGALSGSSNTSAVFNAFFGYQSGLKNKTGSNNAFLGALAGSSNTNGFNNTFAGSGSGRQNTSGIANAFFGESSGRDNVGGGDNAFFGEASGLNNTMGNGNSFFGSGSGGTNVDGGGNSFVGAAAGGSNTSGDYNSFFGYNSGPTNTTGTDNTLIGHNANVASGNLSFATAIGSGSVVSASNTIALGRANGADTVQIPGPLNVTGAITGNGSNLTNLNAGNITSGTLSINRGGTGLSSSGVAGNFLRSNGTNWTSSALVASDIPGGSANYIQNTTSPQPSSNFNISGNGLIGGRLGIGTPSPGFKLEVIDSSNVGLRVQTNATGGTVASFGGNGAFQVDASGSPGGRFTILESGKVGIGTGTPTSLLHILGATPPSVSSGNGTNASPVLQVLGGNGGATTAFANGGAGAGAITQAGNGGDGTSFGGPGGDVTVQAGNGGYGNRNGGGLGGSILLQAGTGGSSGNSQGVGGSISLQGGAGNNLDGFGELRLQPSGGTVNVAAGRLKVEGNGNVSINNVPIIADGAAQKLTVSGTGQIRAVVNSFTDINSVSNAGFGLALNTQQRWSLATTFGEFQIFNDAIGQNAFWINSANNNVGIGITGPNDKLEVNGTIRVDALGAGGNNFLCYNSSFQISSCSSSIRYKQNVNPFVAGLALINRLRPVSFNWKQGGMLDMGLVAEEVAKVEPLLVTLNDKGEIEGVKYDRVGVVLINAVKEQQAQIEKQQKLIESQQQQIEALKKLVCATNRAAAICKE